MPPILRVLLLVLALLLLTVGALWTLQGLGVIGGSSMSGENTWAIVGPLVAGLGVALAVVVVQGGPRSRP
ncbi:hypothetical protein GCM10023340_07770 [Nocardioides marinquilinus]|uniref:Integral membrane protein n=1 Tax=Nocardioides marinquilinus TaxID=1210400 RepID=A0ABP9PBM6_9ACTN